MSETADLQFLGFVPSKEPKGKQVTVEQTGRLPLRMRNGRPLDHQFKRLGDNLVAYTMSGTLRISIDKLKAAGYDWRLWVQKDV